MSKQESSSCGEEEEEEEEEEELWLWWWVSTWKDVHSEAFSGDGTSPGLQQRSKREYG